MSFFDVDNRRLGQELIWFIDEIAHTQLRDDMNKIRYQK